MTGFGLVHSGAHFRVKSPSQSHWTALLWRREWVELMLSEPHLDVTLVTVHSTALQTIDELSVNSMYLWSWVSVFSAAPPTACRHYFSNTLWTVTTIEKRKNTTNTNFCKQLTDCGKTAVWVWLQRPPGSCSVALLASQACAFSKLCEEKKQIVLTAE